MITNLLNKNSIKIISYLSISPGSKYTRKEIKEKTKLNNVPLDESISRLILLQIIKRERNLYFLKLEHEPTKKIIELIKSEYNKYNVSYGIFILLLETIDKTSKYKQIRDIILFGSHAKLIHTDRSDIDIAIISSEKINDKVKKGIINRIEQISKKENKKIDAQFFTNKEMKENQSDLLIKDILRNGKSLQ